MTFPQVPQTINTFINSTASCENRNPVMQLCDRPECLDLELESAVADDLDHRSVESALL